jgi:hypothetical protein
MQYRDLTRVHPEYDAEYWEELRALYKGGKALLRNDDILSRIFPQHGAEEPDVYAERKRRAVYINFASHILDNIIASLVAEPVAMAGEPKPDPFFDDFANRVDGRHMSLNHLLRCQVLTALQTKTAWTLVDLPPRDHGGPEVDSELDQEAAGLLRAYAVPVEPEAVLDWEEDEDGELTWALIRHKVRRRAFLSDARNVITERFTFYSRDEWARYEISYPEDKPPQPKKEVPRVDGGSHSFGRVPLIRLCLPDGLWAMDSIHSIVKEHFNKRSATSWSQYRHLFPILSAHLGPEIRSGDEIPSEIQQDPARARKQVYGIGRLVELGKEDELRYTSPDTSIYDAALRDLDGLRDEIYRVLHQMALAANNSAAALGRSGESKAQDKSAATVVLAFLGEKARAHAVEIFQTAAAGRQDKPVVWTASGMQHFDLSDLGSVVAEHEVIDTLKIPSPTFQRIRIFTSAKRILRGIASEQDLQAIQKELESNISAEEFMGNAPPPNAPDVPDVDDGADEPKTEDD